MCALDYFTIAHEFMLPLTQKNLFTVLAKFEGVQTLAERKAMYDDPQPVFQPLIVAFLLPQIVFTLATNSNRYCLQANCVSCDLLTAVLHEYTSAPYEPVAERDNLLEKMSTPNHCKSFALYS